MHILHQCLQHHCLLYLTDDEQLIDDIIAQTALFDWSDLDIPFPDAAAGGTSTDASNPLNVASASCEGKSEGVARSIH